MTNKTKLIRTSFKLIGVLLLALSLNACVNNNQKVVNTTRPDHAITKDQAIALSDNYKARYDGISRAIGKQDNRSTWYSLAELKQYIAYIEAQGNEKKYDVDGVRFYLGAYSTSDKNPDKQNYTTIFLVPTGKKAGAVTKSSAPPVTASPDITDIDPYNLGAGGFPPSGVYPN